MKLRVQQGIDAHDMAQIIYETIRAGMECDAELARIKHQARMEIIRKGGGGTVAVTDTVEQGRLFE